VWRKYSLVSRGSLSTLAEVIIPPPAADTMVLSPGVEEVPRPPDDGRAIPPLPGLEGVTVPTALAALTAAILLGLPLASYPPIILAFITASLLSAGPIVKLAGTAELDVRRGPALGPVFRSGKTSLSKG